MTLRTLYIVFLSLVSVTNVCGEFGVWGASKYREGRLEDVEPLGVARSPFLTTCLGMCRESHNCTALQYNVRKELLKRIYLYLRYEMNSNLLIERILIGSYLSTIYEKNCKNTLYLRYEMNSNPLIIDCSFILRNEKNNER